jgi:hypothetical protein
MRCVRTAVLVGSLVLGSSSLVFAADPSPQDIAQARDLGQQAQQAFDAGNFAESEKLWQAAANLYPAAPTLTLGLARTQTKLGKFVAAQESYNRIIREQTQNPNPSPAFKDALAKAQEEVGAVSAKVANVVITVEGATSPTVTIDGAPISAAGLGLRRPVDPGQHTVKAEAQGYKAAETTFQVAEAGSAEAKLKLEKNPDAPVAETAPAQTSEKPAVAVSTEKSSNKTLAIVALGVGGAGIALGAITGLMAMGKHSDLESQCPNSKCPQGVSGDVDSFQTLGTLSTVGFIVGGVGLAAGAVLWLTAPKETAAKNNLGTFRTAGVSWTPSPVGVAGSF